MHSLAPFKPSQPVVPSRVLFTSSFHLCSTLPPPLWTARLDAAGGAATPDESGWRRAESFATSIPSCSAGGPTFQVFVEVGRGSRDEIDRPWTLPCPFFCSLCGHFWPAAEHARFYYCHMFLSIAFNLTVSSLSLFPSLSPPSLSHNALRHRHSPQMRLQNSRRRGGRPCSHQPLFVEARRLQVSCSGHSRRHFPHSSRRRRRRPDSVRSRNPPLPNSHQGHRPPNFLAPRRLLPREVLPVPF